MLLKISKFCLFLTPLAVVIVSTGTLFPFIVGKYVFFRTVVDLALIFFLLALIFDTDLAAPYLARLKALAKSPIGIAVAFFVLMVVLASLTGFRPGFSFWSNFERGEGGVQVMHFGVYFFLLATLFQKKDWTKFFWIALVSGVLMVLYGVGAGQGWRFLTFVGPQFGDDAYRFQGSIGNPAYVAAYLIFQLFFAAYLFMVNPPYFKNWRSWAVLLATALFVWAFQLAATRGAFLGLTAGILVFAAVLAYARERWRKKLILGAVILVAVVGAFIFFRDVAWIQSIPGSRIFDISFSADTFETRRVMWGIAFEGWQARPLLGWGPENFLAVFDRYFDPAYFVPSQGFGAWFDRAHSIIFDYLVATGILGLLAYLSMFATTAWILLKNKDPRADYDHRTGLILRAGLAGLLAAYLVQGIILFDVLTIYLNLFIILAFTAATWVIPPHEQRHSWTPGFPSYFAVVLGVLLGFTGIYFSAFLPYGKATRFINAERATASIQTIEQFEGVFRVPLDFPSPVGDEEVVKYLSNDIIGLVHQIKDEETARRLVAFIEPRLWKDDVRHLLAAGQLRYSLWQNFGKESDFRATEEYFLKVREIAPKLPQPLYGLLEIYKIKGDTVKREAQIKEILTLWPAASSTLPR